MVNIADQLNLSLCLPVDTRLTNCIIVDNTIVVENSGDYLNRVDINSRYLGMEIKWLSPFGVYEINDFISKIKSNFFTIQTFSFKQSIQNSDLVEVTYNINIDSELSDTSVNPVENRAIATVINQILDVISEHPLYYPPNVSLNNITQIVENGSNLSGVLSITFTQNDAGEVISYSILKNSIEITNTQNTVFNETNIQNQIIYNCIVCYESGIIKNNNLGIPDPTGRILQGCITSSNRTITPLLKYFWGNTSTIPTSSSEIRSLSNNTFSNISQITLSTGTVNTNFIVCIPNNKSIVSVIDTSNLNANITNNYILINNNFQVADAGGILHSYKLYIMNTSVPYSPSANHLITIS